MVGAALSWDPVRNDLRARVERRLDSLVLGESEGPAEAGPATTAALVARVRSTRLEALGWTASARTLQARLNFARRATPPDQDGGRSVPRWPDLSDGALLATLDEWLVPLLGGAVGRADLEAIDMAAVLRGMVGHRIGELDRAVPGSITFARGRQVPVDYSGERPSAAVRVQDAFGTATHPVVGGVPVVLALLSPAGRPIQVTADLPGFWTGSWADVRKDMAGRYPKHSWPADPATRR